MHGNRDRVTSTPPDHAGAGWNTPERAERARKNTRLLLRRAKDVGQIHIADYAGVSDSTISAWLSNNVEALGKALAAMGLKVLPEEVACVRNAAELDHLIHYAQIGMASVRSSDDLLFDDPE